MSGSTPTSYSPLEAYAVIGNCRTAALVSNDGAISFWCPERFDAPAALLQILDANQGGFFSIVPEEQERALSEMSYLTDTNVLSTSWRQEGNEGRVTDFMPVLLSADRGIVASDFDGIVRMVECISGEMTFHISAKITPAFADPTLPLTVEQWATGVVFSGGDQHIMLSVSDTEATDLHEEIDPATRQPLGTGTLVLKEGQKVFLAMGMRERNTRGSYRSPRSPPGSLSAQLEPRAGPDTQRLARLGGAVLLPGTLCGDRQALPPHPQAHAI